MHRYKLEIFFYNCKYFNYCIASVFRAIEPRENLMLKLLLSHPNTRISDSLTLAVHLLC